MSPVAMERRRQGAGELSLGFSLIPPVTAHFTLAHICRPQQGMWLIAGRVYAGVEKRRKPTRKGSAFVYKIGVGFHIMAYRKLLCDPS